MIIGRPLHFVLKIGDRAKNAHFFRNILGMKVLRHEEFTEGCDAQCNGPYDNRWSKTMIGYGPESSHFVIELTYNYGVTSYDLGNDLGGIQIVDANVLKRAKEHSWEITQTLNGQSVVTSPDGYKFIIVDGAESIDSDPVRSVVLSSSNIANTIQYWNQVLNMYVLAKDEKHAEFTYDNKFRLIFNTIDQPINRAAAYGRIAFAVPYAVQDSVDRRVADVKGTVLTPLITLDTPGKTTVRVIILADPDGHEICFVEEEGFTKLSAFDENGDADLDKFIKKDPFQV